MNSRGNCAAIIPCFNEAGTIGELVRAVREILPVVIVVDDGSSDSTANNAVLAGAEVVRHLRNRGKGAALKAGFQRASSLGFNWALTLDGDGQHHPGDIPALLARAEESRCALIVGNRLIDARTMPWVRRNVNRWMSQRLSRLAGVPLADSQCGLRLVNLDALSKLQFKTEHFEFESELLIEFAKAGHRIEFVPVQVIYNSRPSHIRPLVDSWRWFRWWFSQLPVEIALQPASQKWILRRLPSLQHDSCSVGQFHLRSTQTGFESKSVQFRQAKPALD